MANGFFGHIREFGKLKYVCMAVDRYSCFLMTNKETEKANIHMAKDKNVVINSQSPHDSLNHALLILKFLNVDACEQFAADRFCHDGTLATFTQVKLRN